MHRAKLREKWDHTAELMATEWNTRFGAKKFVRASEFHPYRQKREKPVKVSMALARFAIMGKSK